MSLDLTVVGCSGSFAGPRSPASCYLLRAQHEGREWRVALDLGNGALGGLQRHVDPMTLDAVLLTHLHPDHCIDLTGLYVMRTHHPSGTTEPRLAVHGPTGSAERIARAHGVGGPESVRSAFEFVDLRCRTAFTLGPLTVTPYRVEHPVESYGFRVDCGPVTLAYTGDTDSCPSLLPLMAGADLVLADSAFVEGRDSPRGIHLSGRRAAQAAVAAGGVQRLMLTHIPPWNDPEECRAQAAAIWPGQVELAEPDLTYRLG